MYFHILCRRPQLHRLHQRTARCNPCRAARAPWRCNHAVRWWRDRAPSEAIMDDRSVDDIHYATGPLDKSRHFFKKFTPQHMHAAYWTVSDAACARTLAAKFAWQGSVAPPCITPSSTLRSPCRCRQAGRLVLVDWHLGQPSRCGVVGGGARAVHTPTALPLTLPHHWRRYGRPAR